jgi:hypothetical protein
MLSVIMQNDVMLIVIILGVIVQNDVMLNVIMLSARYVQCSLC